MSYEDKYHSLELQDYPEAVKSVKLIKNVLVDSMKDSLINNIYADEHKREREKEKEEN